MTAINGMDLGQIDLPKLFEKAAKAHGADGDALRAYVSSDLDAGMKCWSRQDLADDVRRVAELFTRMGVREGERIGVMLPTIPEIHLLIWGAMSVTGVALINPLLQSSHIDHLLKEMDATVLCVPSDVLSSDLAAKARAIAERNSDIRLVEIGPDTPFRSDLDAIELDSGREFKRDAAEFAALFHTGGTTGRPKIVPLRLINLLAAVKPLSEALELKSEDRFFSPLPLFHIAGAIVGGLAPFLSGTCVLMPSPQGLRDPKMTEQVWNLLDREKATMIVAVPTSLAALTQVPLDGADLSTLDYVLTGTAPLPDEIGRRFTALTGKPIHTGYGMTETSGVIAYAPRSSAARPTTAGKAVRDVDVKIDPIDGQKSGPGRVLVRGPNVFSGYLGSEERRDDDWFDTGDLGYLSEDGWLTLTGRSKDLIIRSGHNIDPSSIEEVAATHPSVILAAAVGQIDEYAGEVPALYVQFENETSKEQAIAELATLLSNEISERPAIPKDIFAVDEMPVTAVGKIYKPALRVDAAQRKIDASFPRLEDGTSGVRVEEGPGGKLVVNITQLVPADRREDTMSRLEQFDLEVRSSS